MQAEDSYGLKNKKKLLKQFDKTAKSAREALLSRYGEEETETFLAQAREHFVALLPALQDPGSKLAHLRIFTAAAAMQLALYKAMHAHGKTEQEVWEICETVIGQKLDSLPGLFKRFSNALFFSKFLQKQSKKLAEQSQEQDFGGWAFRFVQGDGETFDYGIDYTSCAIHTLMQEHDAEAFSPYICLSDLVASEALGWGLVRDETIAQGCKRCNFRFKRGGQTRVSSPLLDPPS